MNRLELHKILESHKTWLATHYSEGAKANLCGADLRDANLCGANLHGVNLSGASLNGADLPNRTFLIMGEKYTITITNGEYVRAGCRNHSVEEWRKCSKAEVAAMDGKSALRFYPRLLDIIDFYLGIGDRPEWSTVSTDGDKND